jgi:hypothetical protein
LIATIHSSLRHTKPMTIRSSTSMATARCRRHAGVQWLRHGGAGSDLFVHRLRRVADPLGSSTITTRSSFSPARPPEACLPRTTCSYDIGTPHSA